MPSLAQRWLEEGRTEGIFETAIKMIERFNLSVDDVIKELNLKKDEFLEYIKNKKMRSSLKLFLFLL